MEPKTTTKKKSKGNDGWRDIHGGQAFVIPQTLLAHPNFTRLSPYACKLLFDLGRQYSGINNGYLHPGLAALAPFGWNSAHTLTGAIKELEHYGILMQTRSGGKNQAAYYGFTFRRINQIPGRPHDRPVPLTVLNTWLTEVPDYVPRNKSLVHVVHKVCAPDAQVSGEFVHDVHKRTPVSARRAQVRAISEGEFVHDVHSYASMPYPMAGSGAGAGDQQASDFDFDSDSGSKASGCTSAPTKAEEQTPPATRQRRPKAA